MMRKYITLPIQRIIRDFNSLKSGYTVIIFCSLNTYNYSPSIYLRFADVNKGEEGFIDDIHINTLYNYMNNFKSADTIIVGCDSGICISPAVAGAIARLLGDEQEWRKIMQTNYFLNEDIYHAIMTHKQIRRFE